MTSSLTPERPLLISPMLAATIGLEETVMLQVICELQLQHPSVCRQQRKWTELTHELLVQAMPFWASVDIKRIQHNLQEKGLILVEPVSTGGESFLLAINQRHELPKEEPATPLPEKAAAPAPSIFQKNAGGRATYIPANWQPSEELYQQCLQHNIPREFIEQRVKSFVMYQRERQKTQYSWHHTFLRFIIKEWRTEQSFQGARELESDMSANWEPSGEAVVILLHADISQCFIEDSVPEFVLYWRERGLVTSTWNTKFIAHVRRQWAKFNSALEHDPTPRMIPNDYEPNPACFEVLAMANIDLEFARQQIREFILYWQDRKEACASWNTKFLQHVKFRWANQHQDSMPMSHQIESSIERFTDRSWAK